MRWLAAVFAVLLVIPLGAGALGNRLGLSRSLVGSPVSATEEEDAEVDAEACPGPAGAGRSALGRAHLPHHRRTTRPRTTRLVERDGRPGGEAPPPSFRAPRFIVPRYGE